MTGSQTRTLIFAGLAALSAAACASTLGRAPEADLVLYGGLVRTGDPDNPTAQAVAARDGEIVYVGDAEGARALAGRGTRMVDVDGAAIFPGFTDAHVHLFGVGMRARTLNLADVGSIAELVDAVEIAVAQADDGGVVTGRGWIEARWPEGRFPTRDDLDAVSGDTPVALVRADGHAMLLNTAALERIALSDDVADPSGGRYERFEDGRLTGLLVDDAMEPAGVLFAAPEGEERADVLAEGAAYMASRGWTGMHNMSVDLNDADRLAALSDDGRLGLRVYNAVDVSFADALFESGPRGSRNGRIITRAVKMYMDGALGSRGAALEAPYADDPENTGLLRTEEADAAALFDAALAHDIQIAAHAIGDRGNLLALHWMRQAFERAGEVNDPRWRIEHAQIVDPAEIRSFVELGVIASMQPSHFATDQFFAPARLGAERLDGAYAWREMLDAGVVVAGGSDAPVERGDPLLEFHAAISRAAPDGRRAEAFDASGALGRDEALALFTSAPAFASFQEDALGVIAVGRRADFSVFSGDLMTVPVDEILSLDAVMTVVDGEVVYDAAD